MPWKQSSVLIERSVLKEVKKGGVELVKRCRLCLQYSVLDVCWGSSCDARLIFSRCYGSTSSHNGRESLVEVANLFSNHNSLILTKNTHTCTILSLVPWFPCRPDPSQNWRRQSSRSQVYCWQPSERTKHTDRRPLKLRSCAASTTTKHDAQA